METDSQDLVRLTLIENGAAPQLVRALIPQRPLESGEQYRFHFDMTKCIGCRSCEVACNEQNGNPAEIKWRRMGELEGGVYPDTRRSYLSMGCNHCLSADCLKGCPVNAYTKDPITGIVLHSAEACIGCQYCVWNCPYSVPQFNRERGVVGKCDMCRSRLLDGLEPACVNACPENAIAIEIVNKEEWRQDYATAESPGLPPAGQTISTTRITLPADSSTWLQRVDTGTVPLQDAHSSLIVMTTAMQAVFGTLTVLWLTHAVDAVTLAVLFVMTSLALNVSVFHLGRPAYAWRAIMMWRRSWLSREVLCFGLQFLAIASCTFAAWVPVVGVRVPQMVISISAAMAVVFGCCGTFASAFIYRVKARPAWNMAHTPFDFFLSSALIGIAMAAVLNLPAVTLSRVLGQFRVHPQPHIATTAPAIALIVSALWICNQVIRLARLRASSNFESRASYNLVRGRRLVGRMNAGLLCAALVPVFMIAGLPAAALAAAIAAVALARYIFFVSVVPLSMALTFLKTCGTQRAAA
jgi:formate dehydrogenase iron-sulfur subunit